jgi:hypothetical protein
MSRKLKLVMPLVGIVLSAVKLVLKKGACPYG